MNRGADGIQAPLDLDDYRRRAYAIWQERVKARAEFKEHVLKEADAENAYRIEKARRLEVLRANGKAQDEAMALAEGDVVVAGHRLTRDREAGLKKHAAMYVEELERNASSLNREAQLGEGIEA